MKHLTKIFSSLILVSFLVSSCGNDLMTGGVQYNCAGKGVFVCNEGNYMYGNASLTYYNPNNGEVDGQIFYNANNFPLGDVCQSMSIIDSKGYVVVNNSGKIYVIDINTFKYQGVITGLTSPRFIMKVGDNKLYVTDLYSPEISIIDAKTLQKTSSITMPVSSTEKMVMYQGYVYVCSYSGSDKIFKIDHKKDEIVATLTVTKQPNSMVVDKNGALWVLSDGGYYGSPSGQELASLICVNTERFAIEHVYSFPSMDMSPSSLSINATKDSLYYINSSVYKMSIEDALPTEEFVSVGEKYFYSMGVDEQTGDVYVCNAVNFVQKGEVLRYSSKGRLIDSFAADITPSGLCFKY